MNINAEKFLAITAALAVGVVVGCSSSDTKETTTTTTDSGAGGSTGSSAGGKTSTGGTVATGGKASTGGAANTGGAGGTANKDASVGTDSGAGGAATACLGDEAAPFADSGAEGFDDCAILPYNDITCQDDAGSEGMAPVGANLCFVMDGELRPGAFAELRTCLAGLTGNPCATTHETAAFACLDAVTAKTCEKPKVDGGVDPCAQVVLCPGVTAKECHDTLRSFTDEVLDGEVLPCIQSTDVWDGGACADNFWGCIPPYVSR